MRVVLVIPSFDLSGSYGGAGISKRGFLPPLSVGYLAAFIERRGHQVAFIDSPAMRLDTKTTVEAVLAEKPDIVGISCVTKLAAAAYALANELKVQAPAIPVIMGGAHVRRSGNISLMPAKA